MTDKPQPGGIGSIGTTRLPASATAQCNSSRHVARRRRRGAAPRRRTRRQPHRHRVVLRPRRGQPSHPRGAGALPATTSSSSARSAPRYTGENRYPWPAAQRPAELRAAVEDDLRQLGLDCVPVVNLRRLDLGPGLAAEGDQIVDLDDQLAEMIALRDEGKIGAIGISSVPLEVLRRALPAGIVCVQNAYSLLDRCHEDMLDFCTAEGYRVGAVLPARVGVHRLPRGRRQRGGARSRRRNRRHTGTSRAGVAVGPCAEHVADSRHPVDRSPRGEVGAAGVALSEEALARLDAVSTPEESPRYQHGIEPFQDR